MHLDNVFKKSDKLIIEDISEIPTGANRDEEMDYGFLRGIVEEAKQDIAEQGEQTVFDSLLGAIGHLRKQASEGRPGKEVSSALAHSLHEVTYGYFVPRVMKAAGASEEGLKRYLGEFNKFYHPVSADLDITVLTRHKLFGEPLPKAA